jgi:MFS family permease
MFHVRVDASNGSAAEGRRRREGAVISLASRAAALARLAARDVKPAATLALGCAAASTGVVIPVLRPLVEDTGHGSIAAGVFSAAHVLGGAVGATLGARALRRAGSPRRLAAAALLASIAVTLAMAAAGSLELRVALRFLDGGFHLLAITALVAAATAGDPDQRARRAVILGVAIVLGVAGGLGIGTRFARPGPALVAAAVLSACALAAVLARIAAEPASPAAPRRTRDRGPIAPGLLAFCERFSFGSMTVAMSFLASPARVGLVLGVFLVASVLALAAAWRLAPALGPRKLAVRSALGFTLALAASAAVDAQASPLIAAIWAIAAGAAAGSLYASALVLATRSAELEDRARGMATVHAAGSAGHALGALSAGTLAFALPGMLVIAVPGVAVIAAAAVGVWLTVPQAASDCPVIGALDATASPPVIDPSAPR